MHHTTKSADCLACTLQLFMFSGFHGRSSASAVQLAQHSALEQRLAALQDDNAQLRTMYKHLESQLSMASAELGCERPVLAYAALAICARRQLYNSHVISSMEVTRPACMCIALFHCLTAVYPLQLAA
jgi:cell division protein FtsB